MRPDEYIVLDGISLAELVRRGEVTPRALTEAAIERIESLNGRLNAVVEQGFAQALARVDLIDSAAPLGEDTRPLAFAAWLEREQPWSGRLTELSRRFRRVAP
ncbi:MAG TPA: hypothetical protein VK251_04620 [Steroidobacteraceae bacterium]|nr:hypothetical protein [Steroidobacteraceae bacterium]